MDIPMYRADVRSTREQMCGLLLFTRSLQIGVSGSDEEAPATSAGVDEAQAARGAELAGLDDAVAAVLTE
jgi:hypothetical protein